MRILTLLAGLTLTFGLANVAPAETAPVPSSGGQPMTIASVTDRNGNTNPDVSIGERLTVNLSGTAALDPTVYVLVLDGKPIAGLDDTLVDPRPNAHALIFDLQYNDTNASVWKAILGAPTGFKIPVTVALALKAAQPTGLTITGNGTTDKFFLAIAPTWRLAAAAVFVLGTIVIVWFGVSRTSLLRDNLLPQIAPRQQPYSLGRYQMAFWFTLIFASFWALYIGLLDYHTISSQALELMGISALTGGGSILVDAAVDTPEDYANRGLVALGLKSYEDVERTRREILDRQAQLKKNPDVATTRKVSLEIQDRQLLLRSYDRAIKPFISEGWWNDMTTDSSGNALHRVQMLLWTWALGLVFVIGVYTDLAMPQFDTTLLALLGISSVGYVGFKYQEPRQ